MTITDSNIEIQIAHKIPESISLELIKKAVLMAYKKSNRTYDFDISDSDKERIIQGYDDIGLSLMHKNKIEQYEKKMKQKKPWMFGKQS